MVTRVALYGLHTQIKCLPKALILVGKKNTIYSQMGFQLSHSHSLTAIGLKSGKKSINWVSVGIVETLR